MNGILVIFRSRAQALDCVSLLRKNGVQASAVSTPREANVGCGISLRFPERDLLRVRRALAGMNCSAFVGFFRMDICGGRTYVRPL